MSLISDSLRVVLCDDSDFVRRHLLAVLDREEGVTVVGEADTLASSVETVVEKAPDVVVLDLQFPDGSGLQALSSIMDKKPDTTVIMLTNHANEMYRRACMRAGASYFFDKSKEFGHVAKVIQSLRHN